MVVVLALQAGVAVATLKFGTERCDFVISVSESEKLK